MDAEKSLYHSAAIGNVDTLRTLLENDPSLLNGVSFTSPDKTPLHIATMHNHLSFVQEILSKNPLLAEVLDSQGRNPPHLAAVKGHVEILKRLVEAAPDAAREKVGRRFTLLHLCVIHNHLEALKILVPDSNEVPSVPVRNGMINATNDNGDTVLHLAERENQITVNLKHMINATNDDGDSVLHLAVRENQLETIRYLVEQADADVNVKNSKRETALDVLEQERPNSEMIRQILQPRIIDKTRSEKWLTKKRDSIMVVAILIATMAFQAGVTPPGGVWQGDQTEGLSHKAGEAVMSHFHPRAYRSYLIASTIAFVSSLSTILLLISGLPFKRKLSMWFLIVIMWLTITSIAGTYAISIVVVTPKKDSKSLVYVLGIGIYVFCGIMAIFLVGNTLQRLTNFIYEHV